MSETMYETLEGDAIVSLHRKHWLLIIMPLISFVLLALLPLVLLPFAGTTVTLGTGTFALPPLPLASFLFVYSLWLLLIWVKVADTYTNYHLDVWTITGRYLSGIDQRDLFNRHTAVLHLERIQDVTVEIQGPIQTLFNFGDIHVQSAGASREFIMRGIANPNTVREHILRGHDTLLRAQHSSTPSKSTTS
jgi:uncharacterized membrane protein YdbT with pleckstrin-like domain